MKKMLCVLCVMLVLVGVNFNHVLIGCMHIVDFIGNTCNIEVVTQIDALNEIYYSLYEE